MTYDSPIPSRATSAQAPQPKPWITAIRPYVAGKAKSSIGTPHAHPICKLSANENPLGSSVAAQAAMYAVVSDLSLYPDPTASDLREKIAVHYALDPARVICGNGSDELLHLAAGVFAGVGDEILYVRHGFAVYDIAARRVGATPIAVPDRDYTASVDNLLAAVTDRTRVLYLANPNNPTGTMISATEVKRLHAGLPADVLFVLDQAYAEYLTPDQEDGGLECAKNAPNILITRTFSKIYGLAAERIGWGYASADIITALHRIRGPFNVTRGGQAAAIAALDDSDFITRSRAHNCQWRTWLDAEMRLCADYGVRAIPSEANFLLLLFANSTQAEGVNQALAAQGYIVRDFPNSPLAHTLRITIGSEQATRAVATIIRTTLHSNA